MLNTHQRERYEKILSGLPKARRDAIFEQARRQRSEAQKRRRSKARETIEGERVGGSARRADPLLDWALRIVAKEDARGALGAERETGRGLDEGVVVGLTRRRAEVLVDGEESARVCRLSAELASRQQSGIAVGDRVVLGVLGAPGADESHEVEGVVERRTKLARPDAHDPRQERVVAANVDVVVIVVSVVSPPLHPRLIDRYLVAIEGGGAGAVIAVNKLDLLAPADRDAELAKLAPYRDAGVPVVGCVAAPGDDSGSRVDELRALLSGKTCAFVGHSGVGKSSLANALDPALKLETGRVREQDARGRHTTTASSMHLIGAGDSRIRVIDTPGVRYFGLADVSADELRWSFPEFLDHAPSCRFTDCTHEHEPGCAVKGAVGRGLVARVRHETYLRLLGELREGGRPGDVETRIRPRREDLGS